MIAARLGKAVSTVSREVAANGGRGGYRAWRAHQRARAQARRPKTPKLACPQLAAQVTTWLAEWWSPQQISRRLRIEFPGDPMMRVSHETIYQALYVQGRGELRRELARCLRTGRAKRRARGRGGYTGYIKDMVKPDVPVAPRSGFPRARLPTSKPCAAAASGAVAPAHGRLSQPCRRRSAGGGTAYLTGPTGLCGDGPFVPV